MRSTRVHDSAALMARYCDGDSCALRELYSRTAPQLLSYLTILLRSRALAEDVLQDTYLKLHVARTTYIRGADPVPWLYTIARRTAFDELRRIRSRGRGPSRVDDLDPEPCASDEPDSDPDLRERHLDAVLAGLDKLPASQRDAIELTRLQGMSMAEVALLLGTNAGAIRGRAHRGYRALRKLLRVLGHLTAAAFISSGSKTAPRPARSPSGNDEAPRHQAPRTIHTEGP